jgi:hypothetical protein
VNPDLVVRDAEGKVNTVRYEVVNAMLLNEFLKEHRKVEEQNRKIQPRNHDHTAKEGDGECCCSSQRARVKNPKSE